MAQPTVVKIGLQPVVIAQVPLAVMQLRVSSLPNVQASVVKSVRYLGETTQLDYLRHVLNSILGRVAFTACALDCGEHAAHSNS